MSTKCVCCHVKDAPGSTPVRAVLIAVGLIKTHSVDTLIGHLCKQHRRAFDSGLASSTAGLKLLS